MNVQNEKTDQPVAILVSDIFLYIGRDYCMMGGETGGFDFGIVE